MRKIIICRNCKKEKPHKAFGLCSNCYKKQNKKICGICGVLKPHHARGLCGNCYKKINPTKLVICQTCGEEKNHHAKGDCIHCYLKKRKGKNPIIKCKTCGKLKPHEGKGFCAICWVANWRKTKHGFISKMYTSMKIRTNNKKWTSIINRDLFIEWATNNTKLKSLFETWEKTNHTHKLTPSIDRINNNLGYIEGNLQFLTLSDNDKKQLNDASDTGHRIKMIINEKIIYFNSMENASKYIGKSATYIRGVFIGQLKAKGFTFIKVTNEEYKSNRNLDPYYPYN